MKYLTVRALLNVCEKNDYIIVRYSDAIFAVNCKIATLPRFKNLPQHMETNVISWRGCTFDEYITQKRGFTLGDKK